MRAGRILATPRARRALRQRGIDPATIRGSGWNGRIVEADVPLADRPSANRRSISRTRRTIAGRLQQSKQTIPHFYVRQTVAADALAVFYAQQKAQYPCSLNDLIVKATALAVREVAAFRSRIEGEAILESPHANIGIAVGLEDGLVVPVVLDADQLSLRNLAVETRRLIERARVRQIENAGQGVLTVTNLGMFGVEEFTAIINPPESGILAVGAVREQAVARDGHLRLGKVLTLCLSCDHRLVDGAVAAKFMGHLRELLESPELHLIE